MNSQQTRPLNHHFSFPAFVCGIILALCSAAATGHAQEENPTRGFYPGGSFALSDIETINTINGNLNLNVPVGALPPGRTGLTARISLTYNSKLWDAFPEQFPNCVGQLVTQNFISQSSQGGWRYSFQYEPELLVRSDGAYRIQIIFPDGSIRVLRPQGFTGPDDPTGYYFANYTNMTWYTSDGSYFRVSFGSGTTFQNTPWTIYFPDGSRVTGGNAPQRIYDRNNNYVEFQSITWNTHPATKIVDQLNRYLIIEYASIPFDPVQVYDYIYLWGVGGQQVTWTVKWKTVQVNKTYQTTNNACDTDSLGDYLIVVDQITLPSQAGSLTYTFGYNVPNYPPGAPSATYGYGEINSIILPTGAQATYTYSRDGQNNLVWREVLRNRANGKTLSYQREYDGSSTQAIETRSYGAGANSSSVTGPDGGVSSEYFYPLVGGTLWQRGLSYKSERPDGTVIERIWQTNAPYGASSINPYVKTEFTSVKDAAGALVKTAIKDFNYDKNGNVTQVAEYDWVAYSSVPRDGNGKPAGIPPGLTPARVTVNTWYSPTPDASDTTTDDPDVYHKTTSPNLRNAIESSETRSNLSAGSVLSRAEFSYDNNLTTGNLIEQKNWDSTKGAITRPLTSGNSISVTHHYVSYGNRDWTKDAKNNQTLFTYDANSLYVIKTETAYGTSVQRRVDAVYDFNTGLVTSATDYDNNVTAQTTYDALGRPTIVKEAVGTANERWTRTEYYDQARRVVVRAALNATDDQTLVTVQHYDQMGRIRLSRQLENPNDDITNETLGIKVQTRYFAGDATYPNGYQVASNPYRAATSSAASSEGTMGWTRTKSDQGGRVIETRTFGASLPQPWGTNSTGTGVVTTEYDGEFTKVTDQANKVRRSMVDGLGRLARVDEPDSGGNLGSKTLPVQPTSYTYNALGNLTQVSQGAQTRTFNYSSLSRLTSATIPEHGATANGITTYAYDNNGNLTSKTDARSVTTTITYDALNRPVTKTYAGGVATPQVNYYYDQQTLPTGAPSYNRGFARGRLVAVTYGGGSAGDYYGYDELGRVNIKYQRINTTNYQISASYNKAGGMTGETYPSGRTVTYNYHGEAAFPASAQKPAGHLAKFSGYLGDGLQRTYASVTQYNPAGQKERESYGIDANGMTTPLYLKLHYNRRLQMVDLRLGDVNDEWNYNRGALIFYYGTNAIANWNPFLDDTDNNGNVRRQVNYVPRTGASDVIPQLDDYAYDSLNRIGSLAEWQLNESGTWVQNVVTQNFSYDRYGNRCVTGATGGVSNYCPTYNTANNRISGLTYDAAGNITFDAATGGTMTYDAENRMVTATSGGGGTYAYDGEGKRVKRTLAGGQEWWYVYGIGGELLAEYLASSPTTVKKEYGHRGGQLLVVWDGDKSGNEQLKWLVQDHLGSTRMEADKSGSLAGMRRHDYAPFGEEVYAGIRQSGGGGQYGYEPPQSNVRQRFGSKERDGETGLDYFLARYYSSIQGRFTSLDPVVISNQQIVNPQFWNLYGYVANNSLNAIDPTGMITVRLGEHSNAEIDKELEKIKADLSKENLSDKKKKDLTEKAERLRLEREGNRIVGDMIAQLNSIGEGQGLSLKDFSITTDPKNDIPQNVHEKGTGGDLSTAYMFVVEGYSKQIYINTSSDQYKLLMGAFKALPRWLEGIKAPSLTGGGVVEIGNVDYWDASKYGATAARHEKAHRDGEVQSEARAYQLQKQVLEKFGPGAFHNKAFYDYNLQRVTNNSKQ